MPIPTSKTTCRSTAPKSTSRSPACSPISSSAACLDETLVIWGGEFGRQAVSQGAEGRDHNPKGFTYWLAGGGIKGGTSYGETDDIGHEAVVNRRHIRDLHATILTSMGFDHRKLTFFHNGLNQRLTGVTESEPIREILA